MGMRLMNKGEWDKNGMGVPEAIWGVNLNGIGVPGIDEQKKIR